MPPTPAAATEVTLTSFGEQAVPGSDVVAMLIAASTDAALRHATYVPANLNANRARIYCAEHDGYVVRSNGIAAGAIIIHDTPDPGTGVALPPRCVEVESWLLSAFRGAGLLRRVFPRLADALAKRWDFIAAVCWADNAEALSSIAARGYERLGRSYWNGADDEGFCEVWLYDLRAHRLRSRA